MWRGSGVRKRSGGGLGKVGGFERTKIITSEGGEDQHYKERENISGETLNGLSRHFFFGKNLPTKCNSSIATTWRLSLMARKPRLFRSFSLQSLLRALIQLAFKGLIFFFFFPAWRGDEGPAL